VQHDDGVLAQLIGNGKIAIEFNVEPGDLCLLLFDIDLVCRSLPFEPVRAFGFILSRNLGELRRMLAFRYLDLAVFEGKA